MATKDTERLISDAVCHVEQLDAAGRALSAGKTEEAVEALALAREQRLRTSPPVPVSVAAKLLKVSEPTIRSWADTGVLADARKRPRAVTLESVVDVHRRLGELRDRGHDRNLREALLARIDDELTLEDAGLRRSLEQMRHGRKHPARDA